MSEKFLTSIKSPKKEMENIPLGKLISEKKLTDPEMWGPLKK